MFERLVYQQNLDEFLGPSLLGWYKVRNGYALHVTRFIPRALRSYAFYTQQTTSPRRPDER